MGQTVPAYEEFDSKSYLPGRNAVTSTVKEIRDNLCKILSLNLKSEPFVIVVL